MFVGWLAMVGSVSAVLSEVNSLDLLLPNPLCNYVSCNQTLLVPSPLSCQDISRDCNSNKTLLAKVRVLLLGLSSPVAFTHYMCFASGVWPGPPPCI